MTKKNEEKNTNGENGGDATDPPGEPQVDESKDPVDSSSPGGSVEPPGQSMPGAGAGARHDEHERTIARAEGNAGPERAVRDAVDRHEELRAGLGAPRPEPEAFVHEKFRKTELHDSPPTAERGDRVIRRNSVRYLAGQVDSIHDRIAQMEHRLDRTVARFDRRIAALEDRGR